MKKAVFLDRDGVINENVADLSKPEQFKLVPGVSKAVKKINESGYLVVVVTNQPVIAKGFCTFREMEEINRKMKDLLSRDGARIDAVYVCPHHPEKGHAGEVPELKIECGCRKPKPGLLIQAAEDMDINLSDSWMIGDSRTDVAAGKSAGTRTILVSGPGCGSEAEKRPKGVEADHACKDLAEAVDIILHYNKSK